LVSYPETNYEIVLSYYNLQEFNLAVKYTEKALALESNFQEDKED